MISINQDSVSILQHDTICLDAAAPLIQPHPRLLPLFLKELQRGKVDAVLATVASIEDARSTIAVLGAWHSLFRNQKLPVRLATSVADIRSVKAEGKIAILLHFQGANPIEADLNLIDIYHTLGVRIIQLTYNARNLIGDGCTESGNNGLSDFGRKAVKRMLELGIVMDLSHVGERTSLEAIELAQSPVIVGHANARRVCDNLRNLSDEVIKAVAASDGVIGMCAFPAFVSKKLRPSLDDLLNHVDYISELVGPEHIGIGTDFAHEDEDDYEYFGYDERVYPHPPWVYPQGLQTFADFPNITAGLMKRGYTGDQVRGILGGNFLRVFEKVWGS
jgi:membrane dipeptidase